MSTKRFPAGPDAAGTYYLHYDGATNVYDWAVSGGGGVTDHDALTPATLVWDASAHTGTKLAVAGFDGAGDAAYYTIGTDIQEHSAALDVLAALPFTADGEFLVGTGGVLLPWRVGPQPGRRSGCPSAATCKPGTPTSMRSPLW